MLKVLFVCTGNTCRSPMAEGCFNRLAQKENLEKTLRAVSAGTGAVQGEAVAEFSQKVSLKDGIDLSRHQSQRLTRELVHDASLILTMATGHKKFILEKFPESKGKVFTIKEFGNEEGDIQDPVGLSEETYETVYGEIKKLIKIIFEKVKQNEGCSWK